MTRTGVSGSIASGPGSVDSQQGPENVDERRASMQMGGDQPRGYVKSGQLNDGDPPSAGSRRWSGHSSPLRRVTWANQRALSFGVRTWVS